MSCDFHLHHLSGEAHLKKNVVNNNILYLLSTVYECVKWAEALGNEKVLSRLEFAQGLEESRCSRNADGLEVEGNSSILL